MARLPVFDQLGARHGREDDPPRLHHGSPRAWPPCRLAGRSAATRGRAGAELRLEVLEGERRATSEAGCRTDGGCPARRRRCRPRRPGSTDGLGGPQRHASGPRAVQQVALRGARTRRCRSERVDAPLDARVGADDVRVACRSRAALRRTSCRRAHAVTAASRRSRPGCGASDARVPHLARTRRRRAGTLSGGPSKSGIANVDWSRTGTDELVARLRIPRVEAGQYDSSKIESVTDCWSENVPTDCPWSIAICSASAQLRLVAGDEGGSAGRAGVDLGLRRRTRPAKADRAAVVGGGMRQRDGGLPMPLPP